MGKSKSKCWSCCCAPFALTLHSLYAYVFVCFWVCLQRFLNHTLCCACVHLKKCQGCYLYRDKKFKPDDVSLGTKDEGIVWKRATEVIKRPVLFQKDVEPADVVQGNIENCWLMSAFASIAEFPSVVDKVFINREFSYRGKYQVTLYNAYKEEWQVITVDDFFPMRRKGYKSTPKAEIQPKEGEEKEGEVEKTGAPDLEAGVSGDEEWEFEYAKPNDNELWVCVLEKAFAKFRGSYSNLAGGHLMFAFQCLTGDHVFRMEKIKEGDRAGVWERYVLSKDTKPDDLEGVKVKKTNYSSRHNDLFDILRRYDRSKALIGASISLRGHSGTDEEDLEGAKVMEERDEATGLVRGHAYSVIAAKRVKSRQEFELVQLRNPWGKFEWKGDWSDESQMWEDFPDVKEKLGFSKDDDGSFWMSFADFSRHFDSIDICDRTVNYADFHLDVHENPKAACQHFFGPAQGCVEGCFGFWCKCRGIRTLYCGNRSQDVLKKANDKGGRDDDFMANFDM